MSNHCTLSFLLLVILLNCGLACFLNSCPYRRMGRSPTCGQCGENNEGLCVSQGVCCVSKLCVETDDCRRDADECQIPPCTLGGLNGVCVSPTTCCVGRACHENLQCMTGDQPTKVTLIIAKLVDPSHNCILC
ncbi:hypothetical protein M3Y97_00933100 [Aphelenchoides bicaudatus]|nr:hypothetical protein M3Y97_00933100 [Aphelenchoides bicaudatus]